MNLNLGRLLQTLSVVLSLGCMLRPVMARPQNCHRWNCPCAGSSKRDPRLKRNISMAPSALEARQETQALLRNYEENRFQENEEHVASLRRCVDTHDHHCFRSFIHHACAMESLPPVIRINPEAFDNWSVEDLLVEARLLLGTIAIFVEQARTDEQLGQSRRNDAVQSHIELIEELGIYNLLCSLRITFQSRELSWDESIAHDMMADECRELGAMAPVDNRNYMILYALDNILHYLASRFDHLERDRDREE